MHHKMPRHEDPLPHDELNFHRVYPDSHNIHAHAVINRRGLDGALQARGYASDRWQSGQKCSAWEN
jgi:hypothetical protein